MISRCEHDRERGAMDDRERLIVGDWDLAEVSGEAVPRGAVHRLSFDDAGGCLNDRGPGRQLRGRYRFEVSTGEIVIDDGEAEVARLAIEELTDDRLVCRVGPDRLRFDRTGSEATPAEPPSPHPIYQLTVSMDGLRGSVVVNGITVATPASELSQVLSLPINPLLVGEENRVSVQPVEVGEDPRLRISVESARTGDVIAASTADAEPIRPGGGSIEQTFSTPIAPWAELLEGTRPLTADQARQAAEAIASEARAGDRAALSQRLEPLARHVAASFGVDRRQVDAELEGWLDFALSSPPAKSVTWAPVSMCEGRVWELRRQGDVAFLHVEEDGSSSELRVFIADVGHGPQIVR